MNREEGSFDPLNSILVGALGAVTAGLVMMLSNLFKLSRMNIYRLIGSAILTGDMAKGFTAPVLGFFIHTSFGILFSIIFAKFVFRRRSVLSGLMYGYILWMVIPGILFPALGLAPAPWELGMGTFVTTLLAFFSYGGILGALVGGETPR